MASSIVIAKNIESGVTTPGESRTAAFDNLFGGAASVLVNRDPEASTVEVYNDRDGDLVQFFEVLCDHSDELVEWLETVPYSQESTRGGIEALYNGYRLSDPGECAGQFFYLRYAQWGCKYVSNSRFAANKIERLEEFAARFDDVVLENLDWAEVFEKYDGPETVFYCDPPYVGKEGYYPVSDIDHGEFMEALGELEGDWVVSYAELQDGVEAYRLVGRGERNFMRNGKSGSAKRTREHLVMKSVH